MKRLISFNFFLTASQNTQIYRGLDNLLINIGFHKEKYSSPDNSFRFFSRMSPGEERQDVVKDMGKSNKSKQGKIFLRKHWSKQIKTQGEMVNGYS